MADKTGAARLRQAIENQRDAGEGEFRLAYQDAKEIANEIDAEFLEICNSAEREIGRYVWVHGVPAPKDADGEVVPLGTEKLYTDEGEMVHVDSICYGGRLWHVRGMYSDKTYWLDALHLHCPDSWERLEEDAAKRVCEYAGAQKSLVHEDWYTCTNCPYDEPGQFLIEGCNERMRLDLLRRAKALAGRDAKGLTPQTSPHEAKEADCD